MFNKMTIGEFETKYNVNLVNKRNLVSMKIIGVLLTFITPDFMENFFTTYRLPFQKRATIAYPTDVINPLWYEDVLEHELIHVKEMESGWDLFKSFWYVWLLPLPIFFSGRWIIERNAYANDIRKGRYTPENAAELLWCSYGWCWPRSLMVKWFKEHL